MLQQRPWTASGTPGWPARRRWFQSWRVRPTRVWPWARRSAATAEESTPPDMGTAMVWLSFWGAVGMVLLYNFCSFYFRIFGGLGEGSGVVVCPLSCLRHRSGWRRCMPGQDFWDLLWLR